MIFTSKNKIQLLMVLELMLLVLIEKLEGKGLLLRTEVIVCKLAKSRMHVMIIIM
jgi:hypothetical protein